MKQSLRKIVLTTDLSPASWSALGIAAELCEKLGATLTVLSVVEEPIYLTQMPMEHRVMEMLKETEPVVRKEIRAHLDRHSISADIVTVISRDSAGTIVEQIRLLEADLLVLATHGRTGLTRMLLGSVAEKVLRTSPIPVLTVRAPDGDAD